ncbi:MAG: NAD+ synthase [Gemmatimonadota bacterium]
MSRVRIALAQFNATVGDFEGNVGRIGALLDQARQAGADLVAFPELAITGYPPEDLLLRASFLEANRKALLELQPKTRGLTAIVGFVDRDNDLYNAAAVLHDGQWVDTYRKQRLPNYGVFDELRYFQPGRGELLLKTANAQIGITICEDVWHPGGPFGRLAIAGADLIVNINASPYDRRKWRRRHQMLSTRAADHGVFLAYVNLIGGQDELVFDGDSMVFDADGELLAEAPTFIEQLLVTDIETERAFRERLHDPRRRQEARGDLRSVRVHELPAITRERIPELPIQVRVVHDETREVYQALVLGTRDYALKNDFKRVVLGLSGGIDSALVATIAVDALAKEAVTGVSMPSQFSSAGSKSDAAALASSLGIELLTLPIEHAFKGLTTTLAGLFKGTRANETEENLQARVRGNLLMALSNKFGWLVLTTGNKSELATGYSTLYGDMAGGFAVIKDVPKTLVYQLARWRNAQGDRAVIPEASITKPPSAELRPDQKDSDSLPDYAILDPILQRYVEDDWSVEEMIADGFDPATVKQVVALVDRSEYKRRQSPPGVKITGRAFGKDRRLPITSRFRA